MGIYVNGIELPKEPDEMIELAIFGDGKTTKTGESWRSPVDGKCYYGTSEDMNTYSAFAVPPHGRLIDETDVINHFVELANDPWNQNVCTSWSNAFAEAAGDICDMPTIIEAEDGDGT